MHWKIILAALAAAILCACAVKKPNNDDAIATEDTACFEYPEPAQFLTKAEQGNIEAMYFAQRYYKECGRENINFIKELYWTKKLADRGEFQYIEYMANHAYLQTDLTNADRDKSLLFDPLLYWAWQKKMCSHKDAKEEMYNYKGGCDPQRKLHWHTPAQWQKIITSPPTVKDKEWYQFLPKGCEQGECLPK